nr:hypothetical protein [Tanacetum cinerariifolium]
SSKKNIEKMDRVPYASAVGSLMYDMVSTRPDLAHVVGVVSRFLSNPGCSKRKVEDLLLVRRDGELILIDRKWEICWADDTTDSDTLDTPPLPTHGMPFTKITSSTQRSPIIPRRRVMILAPGQPNAHDDSARDSSLDLSSKASSDFHSDASSDSSSRHSFLDHSSTDLPRTSAGPSRKRRRSSDGKDIDPEIQAKIDECIAYADALRDRGIDDRVIVEAVDREESETGTRGRVKVRVERVTHYVKPKDTFKPAQGGRIVRVESAITALTERVTELGRDNRRLKGIMSVKTQRVDRLYRGMSRISSVTLVCCKKMPNTQSGASMTHEEVKELVTRRVSEEMKDREATMNLEPLNENGDEQEGGNGCNEKNENGGFMPVTRERMFQDFLKCKPYNFSGTEGIIELTHWFKQMVTVFNINNSPSKYQVKDATCTLQDSALTWWKSHKRTIGVEPAYDIKWDGLMKLMTKMYCLRNKIQKIETEFWNLTMKGNDVTAYTKRFQELILLCTRMVPNEEDRLERFIGGLPNNIQGNVIAANPTRL